MAMAMQNKSNSPIGIFDSGLGGLTVTKAIAKLLPKENIIYFGDTAHTPWGDKSVNAVCHYAEKICDVLINKMNCKIIVVACNTASAIAMDVINKELKGKAKLINVIDPVVNNIASKFKAGNIGLIGTKQTIKSNSYQNKLKTANKELNVSTLATPLLVPLIEEGFFDNKATDLILSQYLNQVSMQNLSALILGCTHYPILKPAIEKFYKENGKDLDNLNIVDSTTLTAISVKDELEKTKLVNLDSNGIGNRKFYITDYNEFFEKTANRFFDEEIKLEAYPLWG